MSANVRLAGGLWDINRDNAFSSSSATFLKKIKNKFTVKIVNTRTPEIIAVVLLKFESAGYSIQQYASKRCRRHGKQ